MKAAILLVLFAAFLQDSPALFEVDLWPGEGRPVFEAVSTTLELREFPSGSSKIVSTLSVSPRQRLTFDDTRYRTIGAGRIIVLIPAHVTGRLLGPVSRLSSDDYYKGKFAKARVAVQPGSQIEYLQDRAEGTCFVRIAGNVIDADLCPSENKTTFRVETQPKTEWWIHLVAPGKPSGWILVTESVVKLVNRAF